MSKSTKICLWVFAALFTVFAVSGTLMSLFPSSEDRPEVLCMFRDLIGRENYNEFTSEYKILFVDNNEDDGALYPKLKQVRIKCSSEKRMLIALCHEYGHYVALKTNCAESEKYISLFKTNEPIWYGNYDMTETAYTNIDEFCASYIGMWYYNGHKEIG